MGETLLRTTVGRERPSAIGPLQNRGRDQRRHQPSEKNSLVGQAPDAVVPIRRSQTFPDIAQAGRLFLRGNRVPHFSLANGGPVQRGQEWALTDEARSAVRGQGGTLSPKSAPAFFPSPACKALG